MNATVDVTRETDSFRGNFASQYFYSSARGLTTKSQFKMSYLHDFLFGGSRWLISSSARYDYDDFQTWRHRLSAQLAPGYDLLQRERLELLLRLGFGVAYEFGSDPDAARLDPILAAGADAIFKPEGVLSLAFKWAVAEGQTLELSTTYFPDFRELPSFRLNSNASYQLKLGVIDGMSLKLGVANEYVSGQPGDNNTLNYYGNLVYDF